MAYVTGQIVDYSNERSAYRIPVGDITAVSIAGFLTDAGYDASTATLDEPEHVLTESGALNDAIDDIILGDRSKEGWIGDDNVLTNEPSDDPLAQVEWAWLVTYKGNVSQKLFQVSIATADPQGGHLQAHSDMADLANADMAAFVSAFEQIARTPDSTTETVTVVRIQLVGRNR